MIHRQATAARSRLGRSMLLALAFAILAAPGLARAAEPDPSAMLGHWVNDVKLLVIDVYTCEEKLCAKIIWYGKPYRRSGEFKRDKRNPDPALRDRGWCGIEVVTGLKRKRDGYWRGGRFYHPKKGKSYDIDIKLNGNDQLDLRVYLGFRLLGVTETWTRPDPGQEIGCVPVPET